MSSKLDKDELEKKLKEKLNMPQPHILKLKSDLVYLEASPYFNQINYIILFGSCSKGRATLRSDIDLCIITNKKLTRYDIADIRMTLNDDSEYGIETNAVIIEEEIYRVRYNEERLYREIGNGIQLYCKEV